MIDANPVAVFFVMCIAFFGYFLPWIIAMFRDHHQRSAIALLNLFLGCTFVGWVIALVWSATAIPVKDTPHA
jgi:hypothetical protein